MHQSRKTLHARPTRPWRLSVAAIAAMLSMGCAQQAPLSISHVPSGLRLSLPAGFDDDTVDARRRQQERSPIVHPDITVDMAAAFMDTSGGRGCAVNHLTVQGDSRQHWESPSAVALRVSSVHSQSMAQSDPWPQLRAGMWLGALPGAVPLTNTVQRSEPGQVGGLPAWVVITEQTWPERSGPVQGISRMATLAARLPASGRQSNEWLMVHCHAVHLRDYVPRYLDEVLEVIAAAQWTGRPPALAKTAAAVPE